MSVQTVPASATEVDLGFSLPLVCGEFYRFFASSPLQCFHFIMQPASLCIKLKYKSAGVNYVDRGKESHTDTANTGLWCESMIVVLVKAI